MAVKHIHDKGLTIKNVDANSVLLKAGLKDFEHIVKLSGFCNFRKKQDDGYSIYYNLPPENLGVGDFVRESIDEKEEEEMAKAKEKEEMVDKKPDFEPSLGGYSKATDIWGIGVIVF